MAVHQVRHVARDIERGLEDMVPLVVVILEGLGDIGQRVAVKLVEKVDQADGVQNGLLCSLT